MRNDKLTEVQIWRWKITDHLIPITMAFTVGNRLRTTLYQNALKLGFKQFPDVFHHNQNQGDHQHAHYLSEDLDNDGYIDHLIVYIPKGAPIITIEFLSKIRSLTLENEKIELLPVWMGANSSQLIPSSAEWISLTPYITPWHRLSKTRKERSGYTPKKQIIKELEKRGLPEIIDISFSSNKWIGQLDAMRLLASHFVCTYGKRFPKKDAIGSYVNITFKEPIQGPLSLGFGSHFGLGYLTPAEAG